MQQIVKPQREHKGQPQNNMRRSHAPCKPKVPNIVITSSSIQPSYTPQLLDPCSPHNTVVITPDSVYKIIENIWLGLRNHDQIQASLSERVARGIKTIIECLRFSNPEMLVGEHPTFLRKLGQKLGYPQAYSLFERAVKVVRQLGLPEPTIPNGLEIPDVETVKEELGQTIQNLIKIREEIIKKNRSREPTRTDSVRAVEILVHGSQRPVLPGDIQRLYERVYLINILAEQLSETLVRSNSGEEPLTTTSSPASDEDSYSRGELSDDGFTHNTSEEHSSSQNLQSFDEHRILAHTNQTGEWLAPVGSGIIEDCVNLLPSDFDLSNLSPKELAERYLEETGLNLKDIFDKFTLFQQSLTLIEGLVTQIDSIASLADLDVFDRARGILGTLEYTRQTLNEQLITIFQYIERRNEIIEQSSHLNSHNSHVQITNETGSDSTEELSNIRNQRDQVSNLREVEERLLEASKRCLKVCRTLVTELDRFLNTIKDYHYSSPSLRDVCNAALLAKSSITSLVLLGQANAEGLEDINSTLSALNVTSESNQSKANWFPGLKGGVVHAGEEVIPVLEALREGQQIAQILAKSGHGSSSFETFVLRLIFLSENLQRQIKRLRENLSHNHDGGRLRRDWLLEAQHSRPFEVFDYIIKLVKDEAAFDQIINDKANKEKNQEILKELRNNKGLYGYIFSDAFNEVTGLLEYLNAATEQTLHDEGKRSKILKKIREARRQIAKTLSGVDLEEGQQLDNERLLTIRHSYAERLSTFALVEILRSASFYVRVEESEQGEKPIQRRVWKLRVLKLATLVSAALELPDDLARMINLRHNDKTHREVEKAVNEPRKTLPEIIFPVASPYCPLTVVMSLAPRYKRLLERALADS